MCGIDRGVVALKEVVLKNLIQKNTYVKEYFVEPTVDVIKTKVSAIITPELEPSVVAPEKVKEVKQIIQKVLVNTANTVIRKHFSNKDVCWGIEPKELAFTNSLTRKLVIRCVVCELPAIRLIKDPVICEIEGIVKKIIERLKEDGVSKIITTVMRDKEEVYKMLRQVIEHSRTQRSTGHKYKHIKTISVVLDQIENAVHKTNRGKTVGTHNFTILGYIRSKIILYFTSVKGFFPKVVDIEQSSRKEEVIFKPFPPCAERTQIIEGGRYLGKELKGILWKWDLNLLESLDTVIEGQISKL
jgi:hypothetical protein